MISILVPTRGRPGQFERMVRSALDLAEDPAGIQVVAYRDRDDKETYPSIPGVKYIVGDRIVLSEMWNACHAQAKGPIFMHAGDDIVFQTIHWDKKIRDTFELYPDRIVFVHGDDGHWDDRFGTHGFIHENWVNTVGYFVPPFYVSDYNDTHLNDIANALGRRRFVDIKTEHMHYMFNKGPLDQTHKDRLERHRVHEPQKLYTSPERIAGREEDIRKLQNFIDQYGKER